MTPPAPVTFDHLVALSDRRGLFEHAEGVVPRVEHGYCTDDNARLLVVASREPDAGAAAALGRLAMSFVLAAQAPDGRCRNRLDRSGRWVDEAGTDDCWGRAQWGLGTAAAQHGDRAVRSAALAAFDRGAVHQSRWPRAMAFAALGAAEVAAAHPGHVAARSLLERAVATIGSPPAGAWVWPEPRLAYANAALAEALIAAGALLPDAAVLDRGLAMLGWLLTLETENGHLSVTGAGGRGANDHGPRFDQQPIEAAAMADACFRAMAVTGDQEWSSGVVAATGWFLGRNDSGAVMIDHTTGGGFDGLQVAGVNVNQGAESTLAAVSTMQRARGLMVAR